MQATKLSLSETAALPTKRNLNRTTLLAFRFLFFLHKIEGCLYCFTLKGYKINIEY